MTLPTNHIIEGDVRAVLPALAPNSVDCVITSPPYFALRNYGSASQIGLEPSVTLWVDELRGVLRGLARVLKPTGSVWLNLGDTYSHHERDGSPRKSLLLGPERLALAMIAEGWIIRSKIIWSKPNPMPISVRDRLSCTYEVIYFATRTPHYFFDLDAIRQPHRSSMKKPSSAAAGRKHKTHRPSWAGPLAGSNSGLDRTKAEGRVGHPLGKNPGDVWAVATSSWRGAHHAVFPEALIRQPLLATCPERVCTNCGQPWLRQPVDRSHKLVELGGLRPSCDCKAPHRRGLVLDPFIGSGTSAIVAERFNRDWLGIELNPEFVRIAEERIAAARSGPNRSAA